MFYIAKLVLALGGLAISAGAFWWNGNMPAPVGPVPFFGGLALFLFAVVFL